MSATSACRPATPLSHEPVDSSRLDNLTWTWLQLEQRGSHDDPDADPMPVLFGVDLIDDETVVGVLRCPADVVPAEFDVLHGAHAAWTILRVSLPAVYREFAFVSVLGSR